MASIQEPDVGARIRAAREQRGLTLREISRRCGLSVNAISRIERGENSPTLSSLHRIAQALSLNVGDFFAEETREKAIFVRAHERVQTLGRNLTMESLGVGLPEQKLQPFLVSLEPQKVHTYESVSHAGEEFVYCLEGRLDYRVANRVYEMRSGDSLLFDAGNPHSFVNPGNEPTKALFIFHAEEGAQTIQSAQTLFNDLP